MKEFFEKKSVIFSIRILGWISFFTLIIIAIWFEDIIENNKFLTPTLVALSILNTYKKDYKNISKVKRTIIISFWIIFFLICGYIGFLVNG